MLDPRRSAWASRPSAGPTTTCPTWARRTPSEQCVSEMALAGFTGCEIGNKYPRTRLRSRTRWMRGA